MMKSSFRIIGIAIIATMGVLMSMVVSFMLDNNYSDAIVQFPSSQHPKVFISSIAKERIPDTMRFLIGDAYEKGYLLTRTDSFYGDGSKQNTYAIGVSGDTTKLKDSTLFQFAGEPILTTDNINLLLNSDNAKATLGLGTSSTDMVAPLPSFRYGRTLVVEKLETMMANTGTVIGNYSLIGFAESDYDNYIAKLSEISSIEPKYLANPMHGFGSSPGMISTIIGVLFLISCAVIFGLMIATTFQSLSNLGRHLLLGWSKYTFLAKLHLPFILWSLICIPIIIIGGLFLVNWSFSSFSFVIKLASFGMIPFIIVTFLAFLASLLVIFIRPIDAIKERFSKRSHLAVISIMLVLANCLLLGMSYFLEGPYQEIKRQHQIGVRWQSVSEYSVVTKVEEGNDTASFSRKSKKLFTDLFNWYKSIENKEGVYITKNIYTTEEQLRRLCDFVDPNIVPNKAHNTFTVSPNYLDKIGLKVSPEIIDVAKSGVKVYLIPDTWDAEEVRRIKAYKTYEESGGTREDDIPTTFNKNKQFRFEFYSPSADIFLWTTTEDEPKFCQDPLIAICTTENMRYFQSESLCSQGVESCYIKLSPEAVAEYTTLKYMTPFDLADNNVRFETVQKALDGVLEKLWLVIEIFGVLILLATLMALLLLGLLVSIYRSINNETLTVKKFLGFGRLRMYALPLTIISIVCVLDIVAAILLKSELALIYMSILTIAQLATCLLLVSKNDLKRLTSSLKSK